MPARADVDPRSIPVILVSRDRPVSLSGLVAWLEKAGCENLHLVDMASTHPDLIDYLEASPHEVHRLSDNLGPHALWPKGLVSEISKGGPFVFSDPDVIPIPECPYDAIAVFAEALNQYPTMAKAGFGIRIDDIPDEYENAADVRSWESQFWRRRIRGNLYSAAIDCTFALYRSDRPFQSRPAIRTGYPYVIRHLPWYEFSDKLSPEEIYYRAHKSNAALRSPIDHRSRTLPPFTALDKLKWRAYVALKMRPNKQGS